MKTWISNHPLTTFFTVAFLWSWAWWCSLIFTTPPDAILTGNLPPTFILLALLGGFGPSIAGLLVAAFLGGRHEIKVMTVARAKPGGIWIMVTILAVPVITLVQTATHWLTGRPISWQIAPLMLILGFIWPCFASLGEEYGWRGFALPRLFMRYGYIRTSLILGLVWGLWHLPSDYIAYSAYGWLFLPIFILVGPITLTAHSVIMTFLYQKTKGNLLAMILYHYTITAASILAPAAAITSQADDLSRIAVSTFVLCIPATAILLGWLARRKDKNSCS